MRAARVHGPGDLRVDEIAAPECGPRDVVVAVRACGICGSDLTYVATGGVTGPVTDPIGLGHEFAGVVERVGSEVTGIATGQRVVVNPMGNGNAIGNGAPEGAFAPRIVVRNASLGDSILPIPDAMPFARAALTEPLSVSLHAVARSAARPGDKIAVFGAGPIGLGIVHVLARLGVGEIVAIDLSDERLARARRLGASGTINPVREDVAAALGALHGADQLFGWATVATNRYFDVSGAPSVVGQVIAMAPFHAHLTVVAVHKHPVPVDFQMALGKEMTIATSMAYPEEFPQALALLGEDGDLSAMVSHEFSFEQFGEAFATASDAQASAKVIVTFPESQG